MGKVSAAKLDELAQRLTKLEPHPLRPPRRRLPRRHREARRPGGASRQAWRLRLAPPSGTATTVADTAKVDDLAARVARLETATPAASPGTPASPQAASADTAEIKTRIETLETSIKPLAQQFAGLEHQASDAATVAREARERAEAAAKTLADVKARKHQTNDRQQQSAQKSSRQSGPVSLPSRR